MMKMMCHPCSVNSIDFEISVEDQSRRHRKDQHLPSKPPEDLTQPALLFMGVTQGHRG